MNIKKKAKVSFEVVINKVIVGALLLTTIAGVTTPAYAATVDNYADYAKVNLGSTITQNYEISVGDSTHNVKETIAAIEVMKSQGVVTQDVLKELAAQISELGRAVSLEGKGTPEYVVDTILEAESIVSSMKGAGAVSAQAVISVVKQSMDIDSVTIANKEAVQTVTSFSDDDWFYNVKVGSYILFGSQYNEPILWRVINIDKDGNPLLLSENIIDLQKYGDSSDWVESSVRKWLNNEKDGFISNNNFKKLERDAIKYITHQANLGEQNSGIIKKMVNKQVTDRAFLLSTVELKQYFNNDMKKVMAKPTAETVKRYKEEFKHLNENSYWSYWLRTPYSERISSANDVDDMYWGEEGTYIIEKSGNGTWGTVTQYFDDHVCEVYSSPVWGEDYSIGSIQEGGVWFYGGIRPALYLDISQIKSYVFNGDGTKYNPYNLVVPTTFSDVKTTDWYYKDVMTLSGKGAISGVTTPVNGVGTFNPNGTVTLGMFLAISTRILAEDHIKEVPNPLHWAVPNYEAAIESGLINDREFKGTVEALNEGISREDMAYILVNAAKANGATLSIKDGIDNNIKDFNKISESRKDAVMIAYSNGLLAGDNLGNFNPKATAKRSEICAVFNRVMNLVRKPVITEKAPAKEITGTEKAKQVFDQIATYQTETNHGLSFNGRGYTLDDAAEFAHKFLTSYLNYDATLKASIDKWEKDVLSYMTAGSVESVVKEKENLIAKKDKCKSDIYLDASKIEIRNGNFYVHAIFYDYVTEKIFKSVVTIGGHNINKSELAVGYVTLEEVE